MKDLLLPLLHLAVTAAKLCRPGGVRAVIAENLLLKQQLIVRRRSAPACAEPPSGRSAPMRIRGAFSESGTDSQGRHRTAPVHVADLPSGAGARQVPPIVFLKRATEEAGPNGAERVAHPRHRRAQVAQSSIRVPRGLRASSRRRSGSTSTRTSCTACWRNAIVQPRAEPGPRGCRSSDTRQTVCGAWTSCAVRPSCSRATGCSWSWTSSRGASWDSVCIADRSMPPASAACATPPFHGRGAPRHLSTDHDPLFEARSVDREPSASGDRRNQDGAPCAPVTPLCGTADRDDAARMPGSCVVLECR